MNHTALLGLRSGCIRGPNPARGDGEEAAICRGFPASLFADNDPDVGTIFDAATCLRMIRALGSQRASRARSARRVDTSHGCMSKNRSRKLLSLMNQL
jgi:hypothetical protein